MLNYTESAHRSTPIPFLTVPCIEEHVHITEPHPETTKQQGYEAGQAEAYQVLAQAAQSKGAPLTKREMQEAIRSRFLVRLEEWETRGRPEGWLDGWFDGFIFALQEAERPVADQTPEVAPVPGTIAIRKAQIQTENTQDLDLGIICGQESYVDHSYDFGTVTSHDLARLFTEAMKTDTSEAYHVGYLIGLVDALLRARKTYPRVWYIEQSACITREDMKQ